MNFIMDWESEIVNQLRCQKIDVIVSKERGMFTSWRKWVKIQLLKATMNLM